jgi:hypothetical protein
MNRLTLTLSLAAIAAVSAPLAAQGRGRNAAGVPPGHMPPPGMCRIWIDGVPPGHQPRATDCATAQANVPYNGRVIYGNNTRGRGKYDRNGNGTVYDRNGDGVIDDRDAAGTGCSWWDINCRGTTARTGADGGWHQVGRDRNGNVVYERRRVDRNGNVTIERARRDANGRFVITGSRRADDRNGDGRYDNRVARRGDRDADDDGVDDRLENRSGRNSDGIWYDTNGKGKGNGKYKNKHKNH